MQPVYRPPMPPQGMRPPRAPPQGLPSGLPPPQRPPAGYKPSFPTGYAPSGPPTGPPSGLMGNTAMASSMMKPLFNPPVQKMAEMTLNSSSPVPHQGLSNGVPDYSNSSSSQISQFATNGDQNISSIANSVDQSSEAPFKSHLDSAAGPPANASSSDSLQQRFHRDSPQGEAFHPVQSPIINQGSPPPSTPEINNSLPLGPSLNPNLVQNNKSLPPHPSVFSSGFGPSVNAAMPLLQPGRPPTNTTQTSPGIRAMNRPLSPIQPGVATSAPSMMPLQPGMQSPRLGIPPAGSHFGPTRPSLPSASVGGVSGPMVPPTNSFGGMPVPGIPPVSSSMGPPRPGMPHSSPSPVNPPGNTMLPPPHGSRMMVPQLGAHPPRPGMQPPPTSSYLPTPGASLPPPPTSAHPPPVAQPGVPPVPGGMNQPSPSAIGSMQNRYPGASPGGGPMGNYPQSSQGRRLNPDDMPSPLQVIEEDRQCKSGEFLTSLKGAVPPLVTTDFVVKDGGNASPRFIRSTMYNVPATPDMMKQASVPFGLVISPLADPNPGEAALYQGTSLANGPVRCNRCKAYMSPFMMFMDGGRRFQCLLCKQINEVPADYYCHMDSQGCRADKYQRPELCLGSYEFIATPEYCKDKLLPKEPAFIFVLEMSQMMVQRGIINLLCQNMKSLLEHCPGDEIPGQEVRKSSIRVGFITYDSSVHFYKLTGLAPEMCIVCDKENMFVPVPDGVLCDVEEVTNNIDKLMESIPQNFQTTRETSGALSCAIQAGMSALKASGRAGKLFVFHSSLPQVEGPGKLKNREDRKLLGTEKEKSVLSPQTNHYNNLAQDLVTVGCGVDLYLFNESYIDLATIGQVSRLTGGHCYKYTFFQPNKDGERLLNDLRINISRNIAFESVMRVRTSTGVRPVDFFGHFYMSNTHDIELAVVESNKAVAVEIKHDDKITEEDGVYIQVALLYTSSGGQRRLRIINLALNICTQMADLYKNCELDTLMNFFGKQSMFKFLDSSAKQVKDNLIARTAQILACYRKNCASPSSAGQLILPELMKLLPLYINCLTKCDALSGGQDLTCDDRSWHIYQLSTMPVEASIVYYYPRLIPLSDDDQQQDLEIPSPVRTSYEKLSPDGAYLLENGLFMFMWVGSGTSSTWMKDVFGVSAPHQLDPVLAELPEFDNPASKRVRDIISAIREQRKFHVRLFVVPQQGKHEVVMRNYLVEDKGTFGAPSYVDFLCHVHKEIRALLS